MVTADRFHRGMTFEEYVDQMRTNRDRLLAFSHRVRIPGEARSALAARGGKFRILVITEDWCVDSLDTLPVLARLVEGLPNFEMRIFLRDQNPDLMDLYLNRGLYRSIPVFAFFDEDMTEIGRLIERPATATRALERRGLEVRHALRDYLEQQVGEARVALREQHREDWWRAFIDEVSDRLSRERNP